MSTIKQILFIARPKKSEVLAQQLYLLSQSCNEQPDCNSCDIYSCEDDSNEFMLFIQWKNQEAYKQFELNILKKFEEDNQTAILKREMLRLD